MDGSSIALGVNGTAFLGVVDTFSSIGTCLTGSALALLGGVDTLSKSSWSDLFVLCFFFVFFGSSDILVGLRLLIAGTDIIAGRFEIVDSWYGYSW